MKAVPNAILLASLPESELEVGGTMGQRALESLEKYFARVESVWKPVASTERSKLFVAVYLNLPVSARKWRASVGSSPILPS